MRLLYMQADESCRNGCIPISMDPLVKQHDNFAATGQLRPRTALSIKPMSTITGESISSMTAATHDFLERCARMARLLPLEMKQSGLKAELDRFHKMLPLLAIVTDARFARHRAQWDALREEAGADLRPSRAESLGAYLEARGELVAAHSEVLRLTELRWEARARIDTWKEQRMSTITAETVDEIEAATHDLRKRCARMARRGHRWCLRRSAHTKPLRIQCSHQPKTRGDKRRNGNSHAEKLTMRV